MKSFHNTIDLHSHELTDAKHKARSQQDIILDYFQRYPDSWATPFEIQMNLFTKMTPITSIRRAMTNLTNAGKLRKTHVKVVEKWGAWNHKWRLMIEKPEQLTIF